MKTRRFFVLVLCVGLVLAAAGSVGPALAQGPVSLPTGGIGPLATPVGTAFTYQGRLVQNGSPVNGACDFWFTLWDASSGGNSIDQVNKTNVAVSDGYFTVELSFDVHVFQGEARWLAIDVRCPAGSGSYTALSSRVAITPAPYALSLRPGATIKSSTGAVLYLENTATSGVAYGIWVTTAARGGRAVYGEATHGGSTQDDVAYGGYFKATANGDVGVYGESVWTQGGGIGVEGKSAAQYGIGVRGEATYTGSNTEGVYGVYGKVTNTDINASGVYGTGVYKGVFGATASTFDSATGVYGKATASSGKVYGVLGSTQSSTNEASGVRGIATASSGKTYGVYGETNSTTLNASGVYGKSAGPGTNGVYGYTAGNYDGIAGVFGHASGNTGNSVGVWGRVDSSSGYAYGVYGEKTTCVGTASYCYGIYTPDKAYAARFDTSPGDLAEYFAVADTLEPGDVVVVDAATGRLARAAKPNDTAVVGIISTAPGLALGSGEHEGGDGNVGKLPLALAGRVPCKASAENGPIRPGDLLTTASTSGYAMRAQPVEISGVQFYLPGTIIGKALAGLEEGTGVIEVLITLQ